MTLGTHVAFASVLYLGGATLFGYRPDWVNWLCWRPLPAGCRMWTCRPPGLAGCSGSPPSRWNAASGHRTLTHSAVALLAIAALAVPLLPVQPLYYWAVVGGYWSHLWLDMLNIRGIDLFWPSPLRVVTPGNRNWRLEVGSKGEMILLSGLLVAAAALVPLSQIGFRNGLQALLQNFDIAREQYQRMAGTHWYTLELTATDTSPCNRCRDNSRWWVCGRTA